MPRSSATKNKPTSSHFHTPWLYGGVGFIFGAMLSGIVFFGLNQSNKSEHVTSSQIVEASSPQTIQPTQLPITFYEHLKQDVIFAQKNDKQNPPPESANTDFQASSKPSISTHSSPSENYLVQVASLTNGDDAEKLRVELIMLGLENAHTRKARLADGKTRYRVIIGPMASLTNVKQTKDILKRHQFDALVLRLKH